MTTPTLLPQPQPETDLWPLLLSKTDPPADFSFVLFERVNLEENESRYYLIAWLPTLWYNTVSNSECMTNGVFIVPTPKNLSRVQGKGQITIPAAIRKKLGLKKGDLVAFVETDQGILISPQEVVATEAMDHIGQLLKDKGLTLEQLIEAGREMRGDLIEEEYGLTANTP